MNGFPLPLFCVFAHANPTGRHHVTSSLLLLLFGRACVFVLANAAKKKFCRVASSPLLSTLPIHTAWSLAPNLPRFTKCYPEEKFEEFSLSLRGHLFVIYRPFLDCHGLRHAWACHPPSVHLPLLLRGFVTWLWGFPILPAWLSVLLMYLLLLDAIAHVSARLFHRYTCTTTRRRRRRTDGRAQWADSSPLGIFFF